MGLILPRRLMVSSASPPVSLINRGSQVIDTASRTTYTFSSYGIGAASATRRVIACISGHEGSSSGRTLNSATIGGIAATIDVQACDVNGGSQLTAIFSATVPTGTTANIVAVLSAGLVNCNCFAVAIDDLENTAAYDTMTDTQADPLTGTIDWLAGGFVIGVATVNANTNFVWSGVTERTDYQTESNTHSHADAFPTTDGVAQTVSANPGSAGTRTAMSVASYR